MCKICDYRSEEIEEQSHKTKFTHKDRNRDDSRSDNRSRAKSQPPTRFIPQEQKSTYGRIERKQQKDQSKLDLERGRQTELDQRNGSSSSRKRK